MKRLIVLAITLSSMHMCGLAHAYTNDHEWDAPGSCPKPIHRKHHANAPIASCVAEAPRLVLLPAPIDDLGEIALPALTKYAIIEREAPAVCGYTQSTAWLLRGGEARQAPEIDAASGAGALTLLACVILIWRRHA